MNYPWLSTIRGRLLTQWQQHQLPSALLFSGDSGLGKVALARELAQYTLCERVNETGVCGVCRSCRWFENGTHPDFYEITLEEKSRVIKVDAVRELIEKTTQTPQHAAHQVVLIHPAEAMHRSAANALLKTLEHPPGNVYFILVTQAIAHVLPTIRSRCQLERITWSSQAQSLEWLRQHLSHDVDAELFSRLSGQAAPLKMHELADSDFLLYRDRLLSDWVGLLEGEQCVVAISESYAKYDLALFFFVFQLVLYDLLQLFAGVSDASVTQIDRINELKRLQQYFDRFSLLALQERFFKAVAVYRESAAANARLLIEGLLIA